jgi:hypothetical protein
MKATLLEKLKTSQQNEDFREKIEFLVEEVRAFCVILKDTNKALYFSFI